MNNTLVGYFVDIIDSYFPSLQERFLTSSLSCHCLWSMEQAAFNYDLKDSTLFRAAQ